MFRLYLSHFHPLKGQIHAISEQCIVGSPSLTIMRLDKKEILRMTVLLVTNSGFFTRCMDLTLEGLKMTLVVSKHVALLA
jgi:hypothetical protein